METHTFTIPNITCSHCVMTIENELNELEGVCKIEGNPEQKKIYVEWEPPATLEKIKSTLKKIHYPAE
ncbi:MAG: heavy-metal-associated domain-containing protein [Desulfobacterales bacterium]|nr:heavy-metal-associated domain-containing protein [Desulfobacterales bacterium]